ncbi:hypothetical protein ACS0TY_009389 [Phlomoides rotata]
MMSHKGDTTPAMRSNRPSRSAGPVSRPVGPQNHLRETYTIVECLIFLEITLLTPNPIIVYSRPINGTRDSSHAHLNQAREATHIDPSNIPQIYGPV